MKNETKLVVKNNAGMTTLEYASNDARALIESVQEEMGMVPRSGDAMLFKGKPFIKAGGLARMAVAQNISVEVETIKLKPVFPFLVMIKATAITEKGMRYEDFGVCMSDEPGKKSKTFTDILGTATTRARNRALRVATKLTNCTFEELSTEDQKDARDVIIVESESEEEEE